MSEQDINEAAARDAMYLAEIISDMTAKEINALCDIISPPSSPDVK